MATKRYYWLKLKDDFFNRKLIKKLRKIAGGDTYTIIYLKIQLMSIKTNGVIKFEGIEETIAEELALVLDEKVENVEVTLSFLQQYEAFEQLSDSDFFLSEVPNCIGSESDSAERKRNQRKRDKEALGKCDNVTNMSLPSHVEKDIEDRQIDNNKLINILKNDDFFEKIKFVQDETDEYNDAFIDKGVYIDYKAVSLDRLKKETVIQIMLAQNLIKKLIDTQSSALLEKLNITIIEKIFSRLLEQDKIDNPINYFITAYQNEVIRNDREQIDIN